MQNYEKTDNSIHFHLKEYEVSIYPYRQDIIRIICTPHREYPLNNSMVVINHPIFTEWVLDGISNSDKKSSTFTESISISTVDLSVQFNQFNGRIQVFTKSMAPLIQESEHHPREITPQTIMGESVHSIKQYWQFQADEAIYGLGQHQDVENRLNYRGMSIDLYQANLKIPVPILISSKGYAILWDNPSFTRFQDSDLDAFLWSEVADAIDYYVIYGPSIDHIINGIRFLTGKCPLMPKYAFGYVQSKERYKSSEELIRIVKKYRQHQIPLDIIVQDWLYWGTPLYWGQKSFNRKRYPDPSKTIALLHDANVKILISIWPLMSLITPNYKEMNKQKFLFKPKLLAIYDAFNPKARDLYWKQTAEGLFIHGIDGWWCDSTEPAEYITIKGKPTKEKIRDTQITVLKKAMQPHIGTAARYLNLYPVMQARGIYEHQRSDSPKRVVNLTRAGFIGQHRFSTIVWSGDISSRWDVLAAQIPAALNYCLTGSPYWTVDIGGFFPQTSRFIFNAKGEFPQGVKDLGFRELYVRWFQFGTFLPMFRSHGTHTPREVWCFGEPGSIFYDTLIKFIHLRYRLLPYIYSIAWMVTNQDYTIIRALIFDFPHDSAVFNINDQFLFGPSLLICPILMPMYYSSQSTPLNNQAKSRKVYLPASCKWYDFWTNRVFNGGVEINAEAPLEILPLFVRAGSIIPFGPKKQYATEAEDPLEIRIYPGNDAEFILYEDENDTYNYEQQIYATISFTWRESEKLLKIGTRHGQFPGMLETRTFHIILIDANHGNGLEESSKKDYIINYTGKMIDISCKK